MRDKSVEKNEKSGVARRGTEEREGCEWRVLNKV
jgi:hypothetical protein